MEKAQNSQQDIGSLLTHLETNGQPFYRGPCLFLPFSFFIHSLQELGIRSFPLLPSAGNPSVDDSLTTLPPEQHKQARGLAARVCAGVHNGISKTDAHPAESESLHQLSCG